MAEASAPSSPFVRHSAGAARAQRDEASSVRVVAPRRVARRGTWGWGAAQARGAGRSRGARCGAHMRDAPERIPMVKMVHSRSMSCSSSSAAAAGSSSGWFSKVPRPSASMAPSSARDARWLDARAYPGRWSAPTSGGSS
eukprot:969487-Prymnesium_polylepis.1